MAQTPGDDWGRAFPLGRVAAQRPDQYSRQRSDHRAGEGLAAGSSAVVGSSERRGGVTDAAGGPTLPLARGGRRLPFILTSYGGGRRGRRRTVPATTRCPPRAAPPQRTPLLWRRWRRDLPRRRAHPPPRLRLWSWGLSSPPQARAQPNSVAVKRRGGGGTRRRRRRRRRPPSTTQWPSRSPVNGGRGVGKKAARGATASGRGMGLATPAPAPPTPPRSFLILRLVSPLSPFHCCTDRHLWPGCAGGVGGRG